MSNVIVTQKQHSDNVVAIAIAVAVRAEREACAKIADDYDYGQFENDERGAARSTSFDIAEAIRRRTSAA